MSVSDSTSVRTFIIMLQKSLRKRALSINTAANVTQLHRLTVKEASIQLSSFKLSLSLISSSHKICSNFEELDWQCTWIRLFHWLLKQHSSDSIIHTPFCHIHLYQCQGSLMEKFNKSVKENNWFFSRYKIILLWDHQWARVYSCNVKTARYLQKN